MICKRVLVVFLALMFVLIGCQPQGQGIVNDQTQEQTAKVMISSSDEDPRKKEKLTRLSEFLYDFDNDGAEERLELYTSAERGSNGEMLWDDGQKWLLLLEDGEKLYPLISQYVQLGQAFFTVAAADENNKMPVITVYIPTNSNIRLINYTFNSTSSEYAEEVIYDSKDINVIFTSLPSY